MAVNLFDLAAKISIDAGSSDRTLDQTDKKVQNLTKDFNKLDSQVKSTSSTIRNDLGGAVSNVSPKLGALIGAAGPAGAAAAGLVLLSGAAGAVVTGIWSITTAAAAAAGDLKDLSNQTNYSVETLSLLKSVAQTSGTTLDALSPSLIIFQKNLAKGDEVFAKLGVTSKNNEEALKQTFKALSNVKDETMQTALAAEVFGRGAKGMLGVIKEMDGDIDASMEKLRKWGLIVSDEDAAAADKFSDQLDNMQLRLGGVARKLGAETIPAFSAFFDHLESALNANAVDWEKWGQRIAIVILAAESMLGGFAIAVKNSSWNFSPGQFAQDFWKGMNTTADDVVGRYNDMVNPKTGVDTNPLSGGLRGRRGGGAGTGSGGSARPRASTGESEAVKRLRKEISEINRLQREAESELERFNRSVQDASDDVTDAIMEQARSIKYIQEGVPEWAQKVYEFIEAKKAEGYVWADETKAIMMNNAARLEQLRILGEAPPPMKLVESTRAAGGLGGAMGDAVGAEEQKLAEYEDRIRYLANMSAGLLADSLNAGFRGGMRAGLETFADGIMRMIESAALKALEERLFNIFSNVLGGGKGGSGSGSGSGGIFGTILGAIGLGGAAAGGAAVGTPPFAGFAGFFAGGGFIPPGGWGIAGEHGPEPVYGGRTGASVVPGGASVNVTFNISGGGGAGGSGLHRDAIRQIERQLTGAVRRGMANA